MTAVTLTAMATMTLLSEAALYRLLTWLSPSYPLGAFSYSHGLEAAVAGGRVADGDSLRGYVETALSAGGGRADAALLAAAFAALAEGDAARFDEVAERALGWRGSAELALESLAQGRAFLATTRAAWPHPRLAAIARRLDGEIALPIAVAAAAAAHDIPLEAVLFAYLHAFAANLVAAGLRLIPIGQTEAQKLIAALERTVAAAVTAALATPLEETGTAAPLSEIGAMRHETQHTRLFRS
jgi:urease accessory protein